MSTLTVPDGMPTLSRGRHRTPRRGACMMEVASLLAGEPWSDHPSCTHPLLAHLARLVNDSSTDAGRQQLITLVPALVGRRGDDDTWLRLPVAVAAGTILDVPEGTQRILAAGLLRIEYLCGDAGPRLKATRREAGATLDLVPGAVAWAGRRGLGHRGDLQSFAHNTAPTMVRCTVDGIVTADGPGCDRRLRAVLEAGISACPQDQVDRRTMPIP